MADEYNATNSRNALNPLVGNERKEGSMHLKIIPDIVKDQSICALLSSSTAIEAAKAMVTHHCAAVVITDEDGKLIGIVTERDLTRRVVADDRDPNPPYWAISCPRIRTPYRPVIRPSTRLN